MTRSSAPDPSRDNDNAGVSEENDTLPCVLSFNASDPTGAGGASSDAMVIASIGAHALPVVTGVYVRDTREIHGHMALDDSAVAEQAAAVAEDIPIHAIKVGFLGGAEAVSQVAAFASDYPTVPLIAYLPDLSWWDEHEIDTYLDAFRELLLPQTAVLVGNNTTLRHWLLPESATDRRARPVDLARAAADAGVSYVLITGAPTLGDQVGNVLATPQAELFSQSFERIDAGFLGAGDILSAALTALIATGSELTDAVGEALQYLDQALDHGFRPGMGRAVADRLFWADSGPDDDAPDGEQTLIDIPHPSNETKH